MEPVRKAFSVVSKAVDIEAGIFEAMISTEAVDRQGDIVRATGAKIENYLKNPVVLFAHDYSKPPIGRALSIEIIPGAGIKARWQFPEWNMNPEADVIRRLWAGGFLNATSIGFMPLSAKPVDPDRENESYYWGPMDYVSWELLEFSVVPVPANQEALRLAMKSLDTPAAVQKRGRVLSASNERKLREAAENITAVLAQIESDDAQEESLEDLAAKDNPEGTVCVKATCQVCSKKFEQSATLALMIKRGEVSDTVCCKCVAIPKSQSPGEGSPVTETPEPPESTTDPTSNDLDEGVLASLSNLFDILTGA